jgi:hypothetical protein
MIEIESYCSLDDDMRHYFWSTQELDIRPYIEDQIVAMFMGWA